jgi:hypothetical protein
MDNGRSAPSARRFGRHGSADMMSPHGADSTDGTPSVASGYGERIFTHKTPTA